ncbi:6618_t:CDS:2 [Paraglomus occultum]|uniref:6618_t:CDS:1 n=1 Tax=Paraglomus occultum TaxID=144539 RepID=A0A9N8W0S9_9GLOM|nr:6618_t:CDS:2 [Paraglomus occultum]
MRGHNVNIYFSEKTYNKIKPLIAQRKVSEFVNQAVEKELAKEQKKEKAELRKKLIAAYQRQAKNKKLQAELSLRNLISEIPTYQGRPQTNPTLLSN